MKNKWLSGKKASKRFKKKDNKKRTTPKTPTIRLVTTGRESPRRTKKDEAREATIKQPLMAEGEEERFTWQ